MKTTETKKEIMQIIGIIREKLNPHIETAKLIIYAVTKCDVFCGDDSKFAHSQANRPPTIIAKTSTYGLPT